MLLDEINFVDATAKERVGWACATAHALVVETFLLLEQAHKQVLLLVDLLLVVKRYQATWPALVVVVVVPAADLLLLLRARRETESLLALAKWNACLIKLIVNP